MTPEEHERLNNLCRRIEDEQNPKVFNGLLEELNELLGGTTEPSAEAKKRLVNVRTRLMRFCSSSLIMECPEWLGGSCRHVMRPSSPTKNVQM